MTEGVVVLPFFVVILAALTYAHHTFDGRLEAQVEAHRVAIGGAMAGGCGAGDGETSEEIEDALGQEGGGGENPMSLAEKAGGSSLFDWSHYGVKTAVTVDGLPARLGGPERQMRGEARLMCNTEPVGGLAEAFFELVKQWI
jgi:hypothetical protein